MRFRSGEFGPVDGPDDLWRQAADRDREVLAAAGFPLYAPAAPALSPVALTEFELSNGELVKVGLVHGDWFGGPLVHVFTVSDGPGGAGVPEAWAVLADLLAAERQRLRAVGAVATGAPSEPETGTAAEAEGELLVDGAPVAAALRREGALWVARLRPPGGRVLVVVTAREVPPEEVALGVVTDLRPYAEGRQALLNELTVRRAERAKRQEGAGAAAAEEPLGLNDHRRLVDFCVADALRVEAAVRAHRLPLGGAAQGEQWRTLWDRAVRQQMRLAGEDRHEANESVTALVNQMVSLAQFADWFADPEAGEAAVEESIRFTALASEVRSAAAQRAWLRQWHRLDEPPFPEPPLATPEENRLRAELTQQARASWLELWRVWFSQR